MTDKLTEFVAAILDATDTDSADLAAQGHSDPSGQLDQDDNESQDVEHGNDTANADDRESTLSIDSDRTVKARFQDSGCQTDGTINELIVERDKFEKDATLTRRQLQTMRRDNNSLQRQVRDLHLQLSEGNPDLKRQVATLSVAKRKLEVEVAEAFHKGQMDGCRTQLAHNERVILLQQVEAYKLESARWKQEAFFKGSEVLNTCWQASVDEAVARKRQSDSIAILALQKEVTALKADKRQ